MTKAYICGQVLTKGGSPSRGESLLEVIKSKSGFKYINAFAHATIQNYKYRFGGNNKKITKLRATKLIV